jgi:transposase-like protein
MTKQERDGYRREIVRRYHESGMTRKVFCDANGVALSTLDLWIRRCRNESIDQENKPIADGLRRYRRAAEG